MAESDSLSRARLTDLLRMLLRKYAGLTSGRRAALKSMAGSYVGTFATKVLAFVAKIALARILLGDAPAAFGLFAQAMFFVSVLGVFRELGMEQHLVRSKEPHYGPVLIGETVASALIVSGVLLLCPLSSAMSPALPAVLRTMIWTVPMAAFASAPKVKLQRELRFHRLAVAQVADALVMAGSSIVLAYLHYGVWALVYGALAGRGTYLLAVWLVGGRGMDLSLRRREFSRALFGGWRLCLLAVIGILGARADSAINGALLDDSQVGLFSMAMAVVLIPVGIITPAISNVLYPAFSRLRKSERLSRDLYALSTFAVMLVQVPGYFFLFVNAEWLVPAVLGEHWGPAVPYVRALCFFCIADPFSMFGQIYLKANGEDRVLIAVQAVGSALLVCVGAAGVWWMGLAGMVVARYAMLSADGIGIVRLVKRLGAGAVFPLPLLALYPACSVQLAPMLWGAGTAATAAVSLLGALAGPAAVIWLFRGPLRSSIEAVLADGGPR